MTAAGHGALRRGLARDDLVDPRSVDRDRIQLPARVLAEGSESSDGERLASEAARPAFAQPHTPDAARAVVAEEVAPAQRHLLPSRGLAIRIFVRADVRGAGAATPLDVARRRMAAARPVDQETRP